MDEAQEKKHEITQAIAGLSEFLQIFSKAEQVLKFVQDADQLFDRVGEGQAAIAKLEASYVEKVNEFNAQLAVLSDRIKEAEARTQDAESKALEAEAKGASTIARYAELDQHLSVEFAEKKASLEAEHKESMIELSKTLEVEQARLDVIQAKIAELKGL